MTPRADAVIASRYHDTSAAEPIEDPSAAPGRRPDHLFGAWVVFACANVVAMAALPSLGAIAFHLVWISMSVVYGVQAWSARRTSTVLAVIVVSTSLGMAAFIHAEGAEWTELTEVPLMAGVFVTMVWHVRRRTAALAASRDSAERERRAHELKELFVRNCSHEMRTPITVARGYAEMIRGQLREHSAGPDVDVVIDELGKLGGLATRLLMLADVYEAKDFDWAPVDLGVLLQRTAQRWRPTAARIWTVEAPDVTLEADESRLEAALDALVENAVKFTADGDSITIRCRVTTRVVAIEVEDTGVGFSASRAGGTTRASGSSGTGLGLAIVGAIADAHGGRLAVDEHRACGARLTILLPLNPQRHGHGSDMGAGPIPGSASRVA